MAGAAKVDRLAVPLGATHEFEHVAAGLPGQVHTVAVASDGQVSHVVPFSTANGGRQRVNHATGRNGGEQSNPRVPRERSPAPCE